MLQRRTMVSKLLRALIVLAIGTMALGARAKEAGVYDAREYGAKGDGATLDTKAIQAAIDACANDGGGTVRLAGGTFLSGTIFLKSRVALCIEAGAVLLGSTNLADFPVTVPALRSYTDNYTDKSLIYAEKADDIAILGQGVIDGQGKAFTGPYKVRPYMIRVIECRNVAVRDVTIRNSPMWVQHYLGCENVAIDGITVHSKVNANNDGIDIDSCDKVRIANCEIDSGDDAIVLKSTTDRPCRNVVVTNCVLSSFCNALKMGTESNGGFQNIVMSNCAIYDTNLAGIALELVDGGRFDGVTVSNIVMQNTKGGIFVRLGNRARPFREGDPKPAMGSMRNIRISNVQATGVDRTGCSITGLPGFPVENVTIENVRLEFEGGGRIAEADRAVPENEEKYPEYRMFGPLPAYGFYVRHAANVRFDNVELAFAKPDERPAMACDDVKDLRIANLDAESTSPTRALIQLKQVNGAMIQGCRPGEGRAAFLRVEGAETSGIIMMSNDLSRLGKAVDRGPDVKDGAVRLP